MAVQLIFKNSGIEDKRPTNQLGKGEIGLNSHESGAFICVEDTAGNLQQIGGIKISEDAPGQPVRGTAWIQPSTNNFYVHDGSKWLTSSGSGEGGGGGAVDQLIGGDGIDVSPFAGTGTVTVTNDIDPAKGVEFANGKLGTKLGAGLQFDVDGKIESTGGFAMTYKGTVDLTSSAPQPVGPATGDTYANAGASGSSDAVWNPDIPTGTAVNPGDLVIWDSSQWTYIPMGTASTTYWKRTGGDTLEPINAGDDISTTNVLLASTGIGTFTATNSGDIVIQPSQSPAGSDIVRLGPLTSGANTDQSAGLVRKSNGVASLISYNIIAENTADANKAAFSVYSGTAKDQAKTWRHGIFTDGTTYIGGTLADPNILLNAADGSIDANFVEVSNFYRAIGDLILSADKNDAYGSSSIKFMVDGESTTDEIGRFDDKSRLQIGVSGSYSPASPAISLDGSNGNIEADGNLNLDGTATVKGDIILDGAKNTNGIFVGGVADLTTARAYIRNNGVTGFQNGGFIYAENSNSNYQLYNVYNSKTKTLTITAGGDLKMGGTVDTAPNIWLEGGDGSAKFAGGIDSTKDTIDGLTINSSGIVYSQRSDTSGSLYVGYGGKKQSVVLDAKGNLSLGGTITGDSGSKPNILLEGEDGSARFVGDIQIGGNVQNNNRDAGIAVRSQGTIQASRDSKTASIFLGYTEGTLEETCKITAGGTIEFAGEGKFVTSQKGAPAFQVFDNGQAVSYRNATTGNIHSWQSDAPTPAAGNQDIYFEAGGKAIFYGSVTSGAETTGTVGSDPGSTLQPDGAIYVKRTTATKTSSALLVMLPGQQTARITGEGQYQSAASTSIDLITSERRTKENIETIDPTVAWETIKSTPMHSFNYIGQDKKVYGCVVDEVPVDLRINTRNRDKEGILRTYDNGALQARLYTALQTALGRIEDLESRVATLEKPNT